MSESASLTSEQKNVLFLSSLGGVLEFYDFIIYMFLAGVIAKLFFASSSPFIATLKTFAVFAIGYLLRPLGGFIFSHFGDRYGRRMVFLLTVLFMAVPAFAIAVLPTEMQIGVAAPVLLLLFRIMQGLALGGEIPAAITFVSEHVAENQRGVATSILFFGINMGLLLGSLATAVLTAWFTKDQLYAYAWRIPFFLGGIFGIASMLLRRYLQETQAFLTLPENQIQRIPLLALLRHSWTNVLKAFCLVSLAAITIFCYLYWPHYLNQYLRYPLSTILIINTIGTLIFSLMIVFSGWLADRIGKKPVYAVGAGLIILLAYPLFLLFGMQSIVLVVISYIVFSIIFAFITGAYPAILSDMFPKAVRYSGVAAGYNIAYALFGGLSPVICTLAIHYFHSVMAPALYLMLVAVAALLVLPFVRSTA